MTRQIEGCDVWSVGRGQYGVSFEGRDIGVAKQDVVGIDAIKWSAYDHLGQRLDGSYLHVEDAVRAIKSTR